MNPRRLVPVILMVLPLMLLSASSARAESNCNDGVDNDSDTFIDHLDTTCYELNCTDGVDNDGDGHLDANVAGTPSGNEGPDPDCQCLDAVAGFTSGCTANDVSFVIIGLGTQTDGCINNSDTVTIQMGAQLTTTANVRYDIGMYVATDPTDATGNDARTGRSCKREILTPVSETATSTQICNSGPFIDLDDPTSDTTDKCGEIRTAEVCGGGVNAVHTFSTPVALPCSKTANGFVNLDTCSSWDQQSSNGTAQKPHCTNFSLAVPGTNAKCRCEENTVSSIPKPNLAMSCGCSALSNGATTCTVAYTNAGQGTCNQTAATADSEFGCGVARYLRFKTTYPTATGGITGTPTSTRGSRANDDPTGTLTWTPGSNPANTLGWVGVNETDTLSFTFTSDGTQTTGNLNFVTTAFWSNASSFSPEVSQASALTCSVQISATPVTLAQFRAQRQDGDVVLKWTTATETGNVGFNVYAETAEGTRQLNSRIVKSRTVDSVTPQRYRLQVPAEGLEGAKFFLEDVSTSGWKNRKGPFTIEAGPAGRSPQTDPIDWVSVNAAHQAEEQWRGRSEMRLASAAATKAAPDKDVALDLSVSQDGLYRVTYEDLLAAGFNLGKAKAGDLALRSGGASVPMRVVAAKEHFGAGSYLEFHGRALDTLYTSTNIYRLTLDKKTGARADLDARVADAATPAATSYQATVRVEREREYGFSAPNGDPWYDTLFQGFPGGTSADFALTADQVVAGSAQLRVDLWGMTDWPAAPDHHVKLRWNGTEVANQFFDGSSAQSLQATLPAGAVNAGANTLTVSVPTDLGLDYDFLALDSYSVTYPRAFVATADRLSFTAQGARFEVSGLTSPAVVVYRARGANLTYLSGVQVRSGASGYIASFPGAATSDTYHVATVSSLRRPGIAAALPATGILSGRADYLILTHPDFLNGLGALVAARTAEGLAVKVVDVRDVYSTYSNGVLDANAISAYLRYAAAQLGTRYVLLVGGDTYDYRNYLGRGAISFVPSLYRETSPFVKFAPVDSVYADIDSDGVQDVAIGRWPVRSAAELDTIVAQTLAYQHKSYGGTSVFAADAVDVESGISFTAMSDSLRAGLPQSWQGRSSKAYLDLSGVAGAKNILRDAINGGVALTSFVGHSGPTVWTFQGLFNNADVAALTNAGAPTVVSQMGCWNNYYVSPLYDSLAQKLLLSGDRGAAAVLGATGLTLVASDKAFGDQLGWRLAAPGMTLGQAVVDAKRALAAQQPLMTDVLLGWTILGDPALRINP
jgi:Peptidase family C25